jgi:hypothetical protein
MATYGYQPAPKPYGFVPLPDHVDRTEPAGHHMFRPGLLHGFIEGELIAQTPIHVGSGGIELGATQRPLYKAFLLTAAIPDQPARPVIPGSSLKGVVRSVVEAITRSCLRVQTRERELRGMFPRDFAPCDAKDRTARLCPACRLFGAMGYQGQIRFADGLLRNGKTTILDTPALFPPRTGASVYRDHRGNVRGRKFYFHGQPASGKVPLQVCVPGSVFRLRVDFSNLSEAELGLLLIGLGQGDSPMDLKLGGAKPVCCGSMEVQATRVETREGRSDVLQWAAAPCPEDRVRWFDAARSSLIVKENFEELQRIWPLESKRECPSVPY